VNANSNLSPFNYVHSVALVTRAKQECAGFAIEALQQVAQFVGRLVVEGFKQRHLTQCVDSHLRESNGTLTRIAAIHVAEKLQLSGAAVFAVSADGSLG
jgi:hypothetical protein